MPEAPIPEPTGPQTKGGWRRPLSYLLLLGGAAAILFNNDLSQASGMPVIVLQIAALGLFVVGAGLFFSVRETTDRVSTYRQVFTPTPTPTAKPADPDPEVKDPPASGDPPQ
jgi:hypothetical protein